MMTGKISLTAFAFSFLIDASCSAQTSNIATDNPLKTSLDSMVHDRVQRYFKDERAVGLSIGVYQNGQSYYYNYGETFNGSKVLPGNKTLYELGSITKSFTGILLGQAVLDKKIKLDDDIRKYLTGDYPNLSYNGAAIRIVHLSNHTSRVTRIFPNLWERKDYDSLNPYLGYMRAHLYEALHQMKVDTMPGVIYSYSNMGVGLLGTILEDVYHQPYLSLIRQFILSPLGMNDTRIDISNVPEKVLARAHDAKRAIIPWWDISDLPAIGSLRSTTSDMIHYIRANSENHTQAMLLSHQPTYGTAKEGMGLNWFIHTTPNGYTEIEHTGGTGGSRSSLEFFPQLRSGFVILTNSLANRNDLEKDLSMIVSGQVSK